MPTSLMASKPIQPVQSRKGTYVPYDINGDLKKIPSESPLSVEQLQPIFNQADFSTPILQDYSYTQTKTQQLGGNSHTLTLKDNKVKRVYLNGSGRNTLYFGKVGDKPVIAVETFYGTKETDELSWIGSHKKSIPIVLLNTFEADPVKKTFAKDGKGYAKLLGSASNATKVEATPKRPLTEQDVRLNNLVDWVEQSNNQLSHPVKLDINKTPDYYPANK